MKNEEGVETKECKDGREIKRSGIYLHRKMAFTNKHC